MNILGFCFKKVVEGYFNSSLSPTACAVEAKWLKNPWIHCEWSVHCTKSNPPITPEWSGVSWGEPVCGLCVTPVSWLQIQGDLGQFVISVRVLQFYQTNSTRWLEDPYDPVASYMSKKNGTLWHFVLLSWCFENSATIRIDVMDVILIKSFCKNNFAMIDDLFFMISRGLMFVLSSC